MQFFMAPTHSLSSHLPDAAQKYVAVKSVFWEVCPFLVNNYGVQETGEEILDKFQHKTEARVNLKSRICCKHYSRMY